MLGSDGSERDAHDRVGASRVNTKFFLFTVEFVREGEVDTVGLADPVFLHTADLFGPALKLVEVFQEFFGVMSNSEVIAGNLTLFNNAPLRQPRPSITCSFASTVWSTGSQFTVWVLR